MVHIEFDRFRAVMNDGILLRPITGQLEIGFPDPNSNFVCGSTEQETCTALIDVIHLNECMVLRSNFFIKSEGAFRFMLWVFSDVRHNGVSIAVRVRKYIHNEMVDPKTMPKRYLDFYKEMGRFGYNLDAVLTEKMKLVSSGLVYRFTFNNGPSYVNPLY